MDQSIARELLSFVNVKANMEALEAYVTHRLALLHKDLETADAISVSIIQGQIKELRKLLQLRLYVHDKAT